MTDTYSVVQAFAIVRAALNPQATGAALVLDRLELTTLGALEVVDRSGDLVALLDGSAPGGIPASAGSPPSAGTPLLVSVATGADNHSENRETRMPRADGLPWITKKREDGAA